MSLAAAITVVASGCYLSHPLDGKPGTVDEPGPVETPDVPIEPTVPTVPPAPVDPGGVRDACETGEPETRTVVVDFPGNAVRRCPWRVGDNLAPANTLATARIEDVTERFAPEDVVLCDLQIAFEVEESFRYDDNFVLLFGDAVLASADRALVERLPASGALRRWDWSAVAGRPLLLVGSNPYCVGADEGLSRCVLPDSDLAARLELEFDQAILDELSFRAFEANRADLTMVVIGDDDPTTDCRYGPLSARVTTTFVRTD